MGEEIINSVRWLISFILRLFLSQIA